jgi:NitT/TauT family transport system substrate-binding protein
MRAMRVRQRAPAEVMEEAMRTSRREFLVGATVMSGATALFGARAFAAEKTVTATFGPVSGIYAANIVALELGFAKEEGLELKLVTTDGGAKSRQVLAAGQAMFGHGDATHPLQIANRGKPAKMLLCTENIASYANIVVRKDLFDQGITTPEKLAQWKRPDGAKPIVAATAIGSGTWMFGSYIFEGLGAGDRINWVAGGGPKTMLGALSTKQFDAIMAVPSWEIEAEEKGWGKKIYDVRDRAAWDKAFGGTLPVSVIYALDPQIADQATTQAYVNAVYRAMQWLKATPTSEIYARIGEKYMSELDPAASQREIDWYKAAWNYTGEISEADFERGGKVWYRDGTDIKDTTYKEAVAPQFLAAARKKYG